MRWSPQQLKQEIEFGHVTVGDLSSCDDIHESLCTGSCLYVEHDSIVGDKFICKQVECLVNSAEASNLLWDVPLPDLYQRIQSNPSSLKPRAYNSVYVGPDMDEALDTVLSHCLNPYDNVTIIVLVCAVRKRVIAFLT